ncbi:MAG TPA: hypothetical protein DD733_01580 [Clostridiales bacterium]|nr:sigma-70 family RNA polymerase sigma factor [Eubacteriales bacterium]HBR30752.1 hypothetical protein [Clostridiales bacterium]
MDRKDINQYIEHVYAETSSYLIKYITVKCSHTEDIQDILQNTYLRFIDSVTRNGITSVFNPKHYLLRIAKRELAKYYELSNKKNSTFSMSIDDENYIESAESGGSELPGGALDEFLEQEFKTDEGISIELWDRIESFGELTTKIFTLRFVYDLTLERIAKELKITPSNAKNRLYRGLKILRDEMLYKSGSGTVEK